MKRTLLAITLTLLATVAGAQTTISALPAGTTPSGTEVLPGDQPGGCSGNTCKFTSAQIGNAGTLTGDCIKSTSSTNVTCTKTNGVAFSSGATAANVATYTGTPTATHCANWSSTGVLGDAGAACGSGGGGGTLTKGTTATSGYSVGDIITNGSSVIQGISPGAGVATLLGVATGASGGVAPISGATTTNDCVKFGAGGVLVDAGAACGTGGSTTITNGTTPVSGFTTGQLLTAGASTVTQTAINSFTTTAAGTLVGTEQIPMWQSSALVYTTPTQLQTFIGGGVSGGNPTATIGLSAVNGSATTYLRSDGAPALSQAIAPTWTAEHIWNFTGQTGNTSVIANLLENTTAAAAASQQEMCSQWTGQGWKTTATAASQAVDFQLCNVPVQGTTNPTSAINFNVQVNGGGFNTQAQLLSTGSANSGQFQLPSAGVAYSFAGLATTGFACCASVNGAGPNIWDVGSNLITFNTKGVYSGPIYSSNGGAPTISGCGTAASVTGGNSSFTFSVGTGASPCTFTFTFSQAQLHGINCIAQDTTSNIMLPMTTGGSTTTCLVKGNAATSDVIAVVAVAY